MVDTPAPNFRRDYPLGGALIGPAWRAAWSLLNQQPHRWTPTTELVDHMLGHAPIAEKTALNLLRNARRAGHLDVEYRPSTTAGRRHARTYYRLAQEHR